MFGGGTTAAVEVAAVSWKHVVVFALFCEGLASVSHNDRIYRSTVCHCRYLMKQRAEILPQQNSDRYIFRRKAGPFHLVGESWCVFCFTSV